jgi:hypothetical protein
MTVTIPPEIENELAARAERNQTTVETLVRQALSWYLQTDPEIVDELEAWQELRDEALRLVEDGPT